MDNGTRISEIEEILRLGATSVTTDGTTVQLDHESLRRELRHLKATDDVQRGSRPVASSINLSGF